VRGPPRARPARPRVRVRSLTYVRNP
jgi:hypothetical protein